MFYYLDGTVAEILPYLAVIDCGGVGYACKTTSTTLAQLKKGQRGKLYTYLDVGENAFGLYGFATANELNSFKLLIGVSGVGPAGAEGQDGPGERRHGAGLLRRSRCERPGLYK